MSTVITSVDAGSPAERAGIRAGEQLLMINHHEIVDVLDYRFFCYDPSVSLRLREADGTTRHLTIEKEEGEDLGLNFDTYLMDEPRPCSNHCLFCFVDQMPPNMRDTLYFKDDDARLSFLLGNYITLTNLSERELQRIIDLHISPVNISVHATDPELRVKLLRNKNAGKCVDIMRRFAGGGIVMNCQIVCCPGLNDGQALMQTMQDLADMYPAVHSVSIVPVGLTKYREGLYPLESFTPEHSGETIDMVTAFGDECVKKYGTRIFFCSDEMYICAQRELPDDDFYEEHTQLENGVGMIRSFSDDFYAELNKPDNRKAICGLLEKKPSFTFVTGILFSDYLCGCLNDFKEVFPYFDYEVIPIVNDFFGHKITVAGLLTGRDIIAQLKDRQLMDYVVLPDSLLRSGEDVLLDDIHLRDIEKALQKDIHIVKSNGESLVRLVKNIVFNIQNEV